MRYAINFDRVINQLVPYYIGGRKLILYLQALVKPMQLLNEQFVEYAKETRIEASMTSQPIMFEWYLNRKLSKYFDGGGRITIKTTETLGVPVYYQDVEGVTHLTLYQQSEVEDATRFFYQHEKTEDSSVSFIVTSPPIKTNLLDADAKVAKEKYETMLRYYIDKYRLAGKTYRIKYDEI